MKFSIISDTGYGLGVATHLSAEGHNVWLHLNTPGTLGAGIVRTESANAPDGSVDITIFDSDSFGHWADEERKAGKRVIGASHWAEILEKDPEYAASVIKAIGWDTDSVKQGTSVCVTAWFNGAHYIATYTSLVYRRLMSNGCGPDVNISGTAGNFAPVTERIRNEILKPLEPILRHTNHRGCCHVQLLVEKDRYSVTGLTASFNTPLALLLLENSRASIADILLRLFDESSKPVQFLEAWAVAILVSVPPYPYGITAHEYALSGLEPQALKHVWLIDAKHTASGYATAGAHGKVGFVTARGGYLQEAVKRAYRTVGNLKVPDLQYRDDIGRALTTRIQELKENAWI